MSEPYYLIDTQFGVQPLTAYLSKNGMWWDQGIVPPVLRIGQVIGGGSGPALPLTPDGQLNPGILYPSSADPHVRFYLPSYQLTTANGRYTHH